MLRSLYICLLRLHPAAFRQQFGDEMLEIFERATTLRSAALLAADGLASLVRQWVFRAEFRRPVLAVAARDGPANIPVFQTIAPYKPRPAAMVSGGLLALATLCFVGALAARSGKTPAFLIGVHHPSPHLFPVDRASVAEGDLNTTVKFGPDPEDPLRPIAILYFRVIRVLKVLDANQDLTLSPWEIFTAPAALRQLDLDADGNLSPEECGFILVARPGIPPDVVARARREFMTVNPVLAALDRDHDGMISASEIAASSAALKKLDRNGDGSLAAEELIPDQASKHAAMILARLDANGDGVISRQERESEDAPQLRDLLESADRNHDGVITREELQGALRLLAERKREFEQARRAAGIR